jgi:hypothetical protein
MCTEKKYPEVEPSGIPYRATKGDEKLPINDNNMIC